MSEPLAGHKDNVVSMIANKRMNNQVAIGGLHSYIFRRTIVTTRQELVQVSTTLALVRRVFKTNYRTDVMPV